MSISGLPEAFHYLQSRADHHRTRSFRGYFQAVPPGRGRVVFIHLPGASRQASRHCVPGYFQAVPPGRAAGFIHLPGTSCQGYFQAVPPGRTFRLCRKVRQASFLISNQAVRTGLLSRCPFLLRLAVAREAKVPRGYGGQAGTIRSTEMLPCKTQTQPGRFEAGSSRRSSD
jgi:hypothetical protein